MAYLTLCTACFHSNSLENLTMLVAALCPKFFLPPPRGMVKLLTSLRTKLEPRGRFIRLWEEAPRCAWVLIYRASRIKVMWGTSFTVTQNPAARVLSWSPDQGYNRASPQSLHLCSSPRGPQAFAGREANFGSDCLISASGEVGPHRWAFAFSLFHLAGPASVRRSRLVTVS